uniref:Uncharacterized protein n=1 Tax=Kalanchoe fedtschenkoi TaxID=63787 RepID=A0A7N0TSM4_KALFE
MASGCGGALPFSVASVVEDVLQQHGNSSRSATGLDLESRKAEEAALRRYEAAKWLRQMVGVVTARDLPAEPTVEEFRLGLRSGHILCNVLNQIQPGVVPKVVETPRDASTIPDGAALSAYQYFENVRNFLVAVQEMGIPAFDSSDLEQGGTSARVVNCVLALKSYYEWKQSGGNGVWKYGGNIKPAFSCRSFVRKASEPFTNSLSRTNSAIEKIPEAPDQILNKMECNSSPFGLLARAVLKDKAPEEVPLVVESLLSKVVEEIQNRLISQTPISKAYSQDVPVVGNNSFSRALFRDPKAENEELPGYKNHISEEESQVLSSKHQQIVDKQQNDILSLKTTLQATKSGMRFLQMKFTEEFRNLGVHIHSLSHAASAYHRVLEENRKLYNQVQDLKGSIRVYCRVRPFLGSQANTITSVEHIDEGDITINTLSKNGKGRKSFRFNKVFEPNASQEDVFADTKPLIRSALDGYNVCIFAYGQTGSGKTYTMTGPSVLTEQNQGVNYRALQDLFLLAEQRKDMFHYDISVQMMEIYNEQVRDLLVMDGSNKRLDIRNSSLSGLNVPDANLIPVTSTSDVIYLMNLGHKNRAVGSTALNDRSSRSHSCLTVHIHGRELTSGTVLRGCMHLVDLAGSERVDKSEVTGDRLKEAQHINRSLSALGDVIASLAQKNPHVPYRNSKLTQLLQDSLGGQAKTLMFVHISPEFDAVSETISTLKFAERVASVDLGAAKINKDNSEVKELKEQIASLKAALLRKAGEHEQALTSPFRSTEKSRPNESSPYCPRKQIGGLLGDRQPMYDVGNIELRSNSSVPRPKKLNLDPEEPPVASDPWPPVILPAEDSTNDDEEEKELGADGEWVDKVMVNKLDASSKIGNPPGCLEASISPFTQNYLHDTTNLYHEHSYSMFSGNIRFDTTKSDGLDDDAGTSDSSEQDLHWQYNHPTKIPSLSGAAIGSRIHSFSNGIASKLATPTPKITKGSKLRNPNAKISQSPAEKLITSSATPIRIRRQQPLLSDGKHKVGVRKQ